MKPTRDMSEPEETAAEQSAAPGENGTRELTEDGRPQSGAPRSWKEYMEQTMPAQDTGAETEREDTNVQQTGPDIKEQVRVVWDRCVQRAARWAEKSSRKVRAAAAVRRERMNDSAEGFREWLSYTSADGRAWLSDAVAMGREKLGQYAEKVRGRVARHPISPLLYVTLLAVGIGVVAFQGSYARAYVLEVNGQEVGLVTGEDEVNAILSSVEARAAGVLGDDFDYDVEVTLSPVYVAPDAFTDAAEMEDALFEELGAYMTAWALSVDGVELGYAADGDELHRLLDEAAQPYVPENAVRYEFVEDVQVYSVELPSNTQFDLEPLRKELGALRTEKAVYVVKAGDTFNAIARSLDMEPNELSVLNPDVAVDQLWVDQELVIQQAVPRLSVVAVTDETYEETIPSPMEYIETADLYVGTTELKEQGEDGLARINAQVTYLNNVELEREILESTTLKEATATYTYTGTTVRPITASNGYFIWPVQGTITSNFGGRTLQGSYGYHLGIDIAVPYGTTVKAADGGTVIKAGWNNSYGNLVAIRHDNGMVTYYAHNSSLLVSVGDKVYQGQAIALAGSTGDSTGNHCHFEIRIEGTSVNPRNYLS